MSDRDFGGESPYGTGSYGSATSRDPASTTAGGRPFGAPEETSGATGGVQDKATAAVDTAKQKMSEAGDQATTTIDTGMDKAAGGLDSLADTIRDKGQSMGGEGSRTQELATTAADTLDTAAQYLREKNTDQLMSDLEEFVRRNPIQSVLVAAGIGFLLSKAMR